MPNLFRRTLIYAAMVLFGYLLQVCVMPYIRVFGVTPNLLYVIIGIITVAYGKLRAFWAGVTFGLLTQVMLPSVSYLNLGLYSLTTLFCSFPFADKAQLMGAERNDSHSAVRGFRLYIRRRLRGSAIPLQRVTRTASPSRGISVCPRR